MKFLCFFCFFIVLLHVEIYSQHVNNLSDKYGFFYKSLNDTTIIYTTKRGKQIEVLNNQISFEKGKECLIQSIRKASLLEDNEDDFRIVFCVFFDSNLNIKEVRGVGLPVYINLRSRKKIVSKYIESIKKTKGKWVKKTDRLWYLYVFSMVSG